VSRILRTRIRHPSEWCPAFRDIIDDYSYSIAGTWVDINLAQMSRSSALGCKGRMWLIVASEDSRDIGMAICEHNIEIGD
jgi:hypothetical protein